MLPSCWPPWGHCFHSEGPPVTGDEVVLLTGPCRWSGSPLDPRKPWNSQWQGNGGSEKWRQVESRHEPPGPGLSCSQSSQLPILCEVTGPCSCPVPIARALAPLPCLIRTMLANLHGYFRFPVKKFKRGSSLGRREAYPFLMPSETLVLSYLDWSGLWTVLDPPFLQTD